MSSTETSIIMTNVHQKMVVFSLLFLLSNLSEIYLKEMFSRQNVNQNAKMNFLGNYFLNLETPEFISYAFITEIYLINI